MKLRRSLAAAAVSAVIAPAVLLAAPAAFATDEPVSSETTASTEPGTGETSAEETEPTEEAKPTEGTTEETKPTEEAKPTEGTTEEAKPTEGTTEEDGAESDEEQEGDDNAGSEDEDEDEDDTRIPYCFELDEEFEQDAIQSKVSGLPGKIVAGSGWKNFSLTITNKSDADLRDVAFYVEVDNFEFEDDTKALRHFIDLEFRDPASGQWVNIDEAVEQSYYFWGVETMKSKDFVKADLRVSIAKNAPTGDGYSFGAGGYLGNVNGEDCIAEDYAGSDLYFEVLKPGSSNENPGEAKPGKGDKDPKPGPDTRPQGDVEEIPVSGNLAETGSSSQLPVIGLIGGITVVAGAGVVFAVKRRKGAEA
ncbi:LAETG motif-containing sortase-dependent surface protein [Streptomyces sp. NPDC050418]|uniref:LAETG motif-containing sortase-dependent surface protein n=1 Tax=Streptomyces sp. NPDC050418 TaxID=3365612 RepID=UPI0037B7A36E